MGPAGAATNGYRAQARAAAALARHYTPDVVELYSPNATWSAVRDALQGASLVVYMGHGNGWPSKYRDELFPPTQNGFGLNPAAGSGDSTHQYFGEGVVGSEVKLAKNAVVLLNHLCYASGNSEPGLPEGTLDVARQRVDNYAAGFIQSGASAVIAEAYQSPSYFVKAVLGGGRSIQSAWQGSPSANGHRIAFQSAAEQGLRRADGHRDRQVRVHAIDRHEGRARAQGRARRGRRLERSRPPPPTPPPPTSSSSRRWPVPGSSSGRPRSRRCRRPGPRPPSTSRSRSRTARACRRPSRRASAGIRSRSPSLRPRPTMR